MKIENDFTILPSHDIIAPSLLFVLSTFLTAIGLSSFCSLKLCFVAVLLSINIPVAPLSKSTFTMTPL